MGLNEILVCIGRVSWEAGGGMRTGTLEGGEGEGDGRRCCSLGVVVEEETAVGVWKAKRQSHVCTACWMLGVSMEVPNWASSLHHHSSVV